MMEQNNTNCLCKLWQMTHLQSPTLLFLRKHIEKVSMTAAICKKLHFRTDKKGIDMTKWVLDREKRGLIRRWHKMKSREILEWCSRAVELHCTRKGQKRIPRVKKMKTDSHIEGWCESVENWVSLVARVVSKQNVAQPHICFGSRPSMQNPGAHTHTCQYFWSLL